MGIFDVIGQQFSRAGNAFQETIGAKKRDYDPGEFDMWGNKWDDATVKHWYGGGTPPPGQTTPDWAKNRLGVMGGAQQYSTSKGPQSAGAYGWSPTYNPSQGPASIEHLTGQPYKAPTTSPTQAAVTPQTPANAYGQGVSANQARWDALYKQAASQQNPYADGSATQAALRQSDANVSRAFANAERQGQDALAARGMMGSGQEAGVLGAIQADRANAYSSGRNAIESQFADKSNTWQQNQNSALAQLLSAQYGAMGGYINQSQEARAEATFARETENQAAQLGIDRERLQIAKQQIQSAIDSGNQNLAASIASGLVQTAGRIAESPEARSFIASLLSGGKGTYPGAPYKV